MDRTRVCVSCGETKPQSEFMRRNGQTWFVPAGTNTAQPTEPLFPRVANDDCNLCYAIDAVRVGKENR